MVARIYNKLNTYCSRTPCAFYIVPEQCSKCFRTVNGSRNSSEQSCDCLLFHSISVPKIRSTPNSKWSSLLSCLCLVDSLTELYIHGKLINYAVKRCRPIASFYWLVNTFTPCLTGHHISPKHAIHPA
jgi:hypothetical protein